MPRVALCFLCPKPGEYSSVSCAEGSGTPCCGPAPAQAKAHCAVPAHVWLVGDHSAPWPLPQHMLCVATTAVFYK